MRLAYRGVVVAALAVAVVGAGRGASSEAGKPASQIAKDAYHAAVSARSVRVKGSVTTNGQQLGVNLAIRRGEAVAGSLSLQGNTINMVVIRSDVFFSASAAYYQSQGESSTVASELNEKWVKLPKSQAKSFSEFENLKQLLGNLGHPTGTLSKDGTSSVSGTAVILVKSTKGGEVAVAAHGTPYPLQLLAGSAGTGSLTFSRWNKPVSIQKPASFIDLSKSS